MTWTPDRPIVSLKDVHRSFGTLEVLKGISMDVMKGEVVCIIGPSGSGKSTLIRCINALNDIQGGSITVEGQEVHDDKLDKLALRKKVGMVFQQYNLFPHKTALENVMMAPIKVLKQKRSDVEIQARTLLQKVRLQDKADSYPGELSGGQQQRVAIARSLAMNPAVHALRRGDRGPRSGNGQGGTVNHQGPGVRGHDLHPGDPRDGFRSRSGRPYLFHRQGRDRRARPPGNFLRRREGSAHQGVPQPDSVTTIADGMTIVLAPRRLAARDHTHGEDVLIRSGPCGDERSPGITATPVSMRSFSGLVAANGFTIHGKAWGIDRWDMTTGLSS